MRPVPSSILSDIAKPNLGGMPKSGAMVERSAALHLDRLSASTRFAFCVVAFAALMALSAQVRVPVPWSDVPMTLQSFAMLLGGFTLAPIAACTAMLLYLGCGVVGLPIFAPGSAGLFGATGGYLVGFVFAAMTISVLRGRHEASAGRLLFSGAAGLSVLFAFGLAWRFVFAIILGVDAGSLLAAGVVPFIPKAIVELLLAVTMTKCVGRALPAKK